eukprot:3321065-Prymnesium_polylepis.1
MPSSGAAGSGQYAPHEAILHVSSARCAADRSGCPKMACQRCSNMNPSSRSLSPGASNPPAASSAQTHGARPEPTT